MSRPLQSEGLSILTQLSNMSLEETGNIKNIEREICLASPATPSSASTEYGATQQEETEYDAARQEEDELEWQIASLPERMATDFQLVTRPQVPPQDDPNYEYMLNSFRVWQQWWALPGIDLNEGNNRTRFRAAYCHVAFDSRPDAWLDMTPSETYWSMYNWDQKLRKTAQDNRKLAAYTIRGQAELKQLPEDIDANFDFVFRSEGRVRKVNGQSDFCQGKLETYDKETFEIEQQALIVHYLGNYKRHRQWLQDNDEFVYRTSKRFHDGTHKEAHWMVLQEPNERLGDVDAYQKNAITHLKLTYKFRTPTYDPYSPSLPTVTVPPNRKYAKVRGPSARVTRLGTQEALISQYNNEHLLTAHPVGAPGRPTARVRRRTSLSNHHQHHPHPLSSHPKTPKKTKTQLRHTRQHLYSLTHKTKTQKLVEKQQVPIRQDGVLGELDRLHWVLDDEGVFRDYCYFEDYEDLEASWWWEMEVPGVVGTREVEGGRRFSLGEGEEEEDEDE